MKDLNKFIHTTLLLHPFCENISANSAFNSLSFKTRRRLVIERFISFNLIICDHQ